MNLKAVANILGKVLLAEAALLLLPLAAAVWYREPLSPFLWTIFILLLAGGGLSAAKPRTADIFAREGFVCVGLSWVLMSVFGALPFVFSGDIPNYLDALFETVSGFTTTGASILSNPERLSRGCMFWRLFSHWIGGMGVLVFIAAILPVSGDHYIHIMRAEVPGPTVSKLVPRVRKTARILYMIYLVLTLLECVLLMLGRMSFYDALLHSFATAGTGGFSTRAESVGAFQSPFIGGCAGSTGGGIKVSRIVILMKAYVNELKGMIHPTRVKRIWFESRPVRDETVRSIQVFFFVYLLAAGLGVLVLSLDGKDLTTNLTASIACISNVGPGLSAVGPVENYSFFSAVSKLILCFEMLLGRLEIFPMLFLLTPSVWKKR